jgi:hypothetical protein
MKVLVNIYNKGNLFGLQTPAYNVSMDESLYQFYKDIGFSIELSKAKALTATPIKAPETKPTEAKEKQEAPKPIAKPESIKKEASPEPRSEEWMSKDHYDEPELLLMSNHQLKQILNKRGHISKKTGLHDPFAPKYVDRKKDLIDKILKTNVN